MAINGARAWVEVDLDALRSNYETIRRAVGDAAVVPMVKADAYGLGVQQVVPALEALDPWGYGVATAEEGRELRVLVDRPILVTSPLPAADVALAARMRLTPSFSSVGELDRWAAAVESLIPHGLDQPVDFHIEVDTGMGRSGFDWRRVADWGPVVADRTGGALRWTGVYTHFHSGDGAERAATAEQWERFQDTLVQLPVPRGSLMVHAAASSVALRWSEYTADAVRPGIFLYGGEPSPGLEGLPDPAPVVSVRARLLLTRTVPAGSTLGYEATHVADGEERWGTVAMGYGDGLPRALSNRGAAIVRGRRVPIVGRISMDMTTILLDGVDAEPGDVVTFIGAAGGSSITLEEVAAHAGTIGYEILTGLGQRLPRRVLENVEESETT